MRLYSAIVWFVCLAQLCLGQLPQFGLYELTEQYNGQYEYSMAGNTLLPGLSFVPENCQIMKASSADLNIPQNGSIVKAYLYWTATSEPLQNIHLNDQKVKAEYSKIFALGGNRNLPITYGKADVTEIVKASGSGTYTYSGVSEEINRTKYKFCPGGLYAGWSIIVIYEDNDLAYNSISLYEGFRMITGKEVVFADLDVNTSENSKGRVSFLAWEGNFAGAEEVMYFNEHPLENEWNTYNHLLFNHSNSYSGNEKNWSMDLDYFDISDYIHSDLDRAMIKFSNFGPGEGSVYLQLLVVGIENRLPNPALKLLEARPNTCGDTSVEMVFEVSNPNTSEVLPSGIDVNFYRTVFDKEWLAGYTTNRPVEPYTSYRDSIIVPVDDHRLDQLIVEGEINMYAEGGTITKELFQADNFDELHVKNVGVPNLFFPTAFTPNGNQRNDGFYLLNGRDCGRNIADFLLTIYDRYGNQVYQTSDITASWDGRNADAMLPPGSYMWMAEYGSKHVPGSYVRSGLVTLFR